MNVTQPGFYSKLLAGLCLLATCLLASPAALMADDPERPLFAYVGTFSSPLKDTLPTQVDLPPGNGAGIHIFEVNRSTGALVPRGTFPLGTSPSHLAINSDGTRLYSANETDRFGKDKHGSISSFEINPTDGNLRPLGTVDAGGAGPTYVSIHPSGKYLFAANYFAGSVSVLPIQSDGSLGNATDIQNDSGPIGPTRATNAPQGSFAFSGHDRTHAHMIQSDPSGQFVIHVDLGLDKIYVWKFNAVDGTLSPGKNHVVSLPPGDGPRHFHFHPHGRWFYSIQEEGSTIALFDYESSTGKLTNRQTISTLPPTYAGSNFCSEILVSQDGKFVYAGNRLHDSIGIFAVGADGQLQFVDYTWTRGNYPRSFAFDPSGEFLYSCNQRADNIAIFQVNQDSGKLKFTEQYVPVGNPSCIVFLQPKKQ
ncbi:lactonase family protein [Planctomycetes bacterium K23_9]